MIKLAVFVILSLYFQGSSGKPQPPYDWCPSNVIGGECSEYKPCKPGYTCGKKTKLCCRDPVCPSGWLEGESCTIIGGQKTCPEGYMCMPNDFCCRSTVCPSGSIGPKCDKINKCKIGYICREGYCCAHPRCINGWIEGDRVCNLSQGEARCPFGFDCVNDFCCKNPNYCSPEKRGGNCYSGKCKYGYVCKDNVCCQK